MEELSRRDITLQALDYLNIRRGRESSNGELAVHCPFHKDNTPSMYIDINRGVYNCFSCGDSGSIESLFYKIIGKSLYKTLDISNTPFNLFSRNSISLQQSAIERSTERDISVQFNRDELHPYTDSKECIEYIQSRGISFSTANKMGFKWTPFTKINGTVFKNRLVIPIYENGRITSFEGRRLSDTNEKKSIYPYNSSVNLLYDYDNLDKESTVLACEGLMDLAVLRTSSKYDLDNSTSIFGANITSKQMELIETFKKFVYINDLDEAGFKTLEKLQKSGLDNVYYLELPKEINNIKIKDIGDLPKAGVTIDYLIDRKWFRYIRKL